MAWAVLDDELYVIGGRDARREVVDQVVRYDATADRWAEAPSLREPRYGAAAVALSGRIYVIGGRDEENVLETVEVYDPVEARWTSGPELEDPREGHAAVVLGGRIYVLGGVDEDGEPAATIEVFDPAVGEWESLEDEQPGNGPGAVIGFGAVVVGDALYTFGGFRQLPGGGPPVYLPVNAVQRFRAQEGLHQITPPGLFKARGNLRAVAVQDSIYIIGGVGAEYRALREVLSFQPRGQGHWGVVPSLSEGRYSFAAAEISGRIYVVGGYTSGGSGGPPAAISSMEVYDPQGDHTAREGPDLPEDLVLLQNFPNPFAEGTSIAFVATGAVQAPADLEVFDVFGRRIALLTRGAVAPGRHEVRWDGRADDGRRVASGVYFYRLRQGPFQLTRSLTVVSP